MRRQTKPQQRRLTMSKQSMIKTLAARKALSSATIMALCF
jgi:hypothetical protein